MDVACGLGGTAEYIQKKGWGRLTGFDIDEKAIQYAKRTYPQVNFYVSDVAHVSDVITSPNFDVLTIVNSFACFPDQPQAMKELRKLAKPSTQLVIFDYTDLSTNNENHITGKNKNLFVSFMPIRLKEFSVLADESGWKISKIVVLDEAFERWYRQFLDRLESKRNEIDEKFGNGATDYVKNKFEVIYNAIKDKWLGGCLIILTSI